MAPPGRERLALIGVDESGTGLKVNYIEYIRKTFPSTPSNYAARQKQLLEVPR